MTLTRRECDAIVEALKDFKVKTVEYQGWRTRSAKTANGTPRPFQPYGQAIHHDAATEMMSDPVVLRLMIEGRIDLAGPLCNAWIDSDSTCYLIAAGNANHAGYNEADVHARLRIGLAPRGDARDDPDKDSVVGNAYLWGWECRNAGDGKDKWEQLAAMERGSAAVADALGLSASQIAAHRELTARKIDPAGIDMTLFRRDVARIMAVPNPGEPEMGKAVIAKKKGRPEWWVTDGITKKHLIGTEGRTEAAELVYAGFAEWNNGKPYEDGRYDKFIDRAVTVRSP